MGSVQLGNKTLHEDFSYQNRWLGERDSASGRRRRVRGPDFFRRGFPCHLVGKTRGGRAKQAIEGGRPGGRAGPGYEEWVKEGMKFYWRMVDHYYTTPFIELFPRPTERWNLFYAVIRVLAGGVEEAGISAGG